MDEGTVEVIDTIEITSNGVPKAKKPDPSITWDFQEGLHLLPPHLCDEYSVLVQSGEYGSLGLRSHLYRAKVAEKSLNTHVAACVATLSRERFSLDPQSAARGKNRIFLSSLDNSVLERYCAKYNVSYDSFAKDRDYAGMIEAILDEMFVTV